MKKKNSYEPTTYTAKKGEEAGRNAVKEHAEASKAMQIAADLARSDDNNAVLFASAPQKSRKQAGLSQG